jgi:transketolase
MTIVCPGDAVEVRLAVRAGLEYGGPVYLRLGKKNEPVVHENEPLFIVGKGIVLREGSDTCILSTGNVVSLALEAAASLEGKGVSARVVSFHTVKPLDNELLAESFSTFKVVATVEEHSLLGGLGGSVAEWLVDHGHQETTLCRIGTVDQFMTGAGSQQNAREVMGLTPENITDKILLAMER